MGSFGLGKKGRGRSTPPPPPHCASSVYLFCFISLYLPVLKMNLKLNANMHYYDYLPTKGGVLLLDGHFCLGQKRKGAMCPQPQWRRNALRRQSFKGAAIVCDQWLAPLKLCLFRVFRRHCPAPSPSSCVPHAHDTT